MLDGKSDLQRIQGAHMGIIRETPIKVVRNIKRFNAWLLPPNRYLANIKLGLSVLEEAFFVAKNFVDGTVEVSGKVLYEDDYHQRRLDQYNGEKHLVVLVPGYMQPQSGLERLERSLSNELFDAFTYIWADFPYSQDIRRSADQLYEVVHDLAANTRASEIYLVGHSQGGLIIRSMVQCKANMELAVRKCLFLSTPHQGTWTALAAITHGGIRKAMNIVPYVRKVKGESGLQLIPGSEFLSYLNSCPLPKNIRFASIYYALDQLIWPPTNAVFPYPEAENHYINKVGHAMPLYCGRAVQIAIRFLYGNSTSVKPRSKNPPI